MLRTLGVPFHWRRLLLGWWLLLGASLLIAWIAVPKSYTATTELVYKTDRLPWSTFKPGALPRTDPDKSDAIEQLQAEALTGSLPVWKEIAFIFLVDQLAFDIYDFRPFLFSREISLAAMERSGFAAELGKGTLPDDLLALQLTEELSAKLDEQRQVLTIAYTAPSRPMAEAMTRAYAELLHEWIERLMDEQDASAMARITERVGVLEAEVTRLGQEVAAFEAREGLVEPSALLPATLPRLLAAEQRAAMFRALAAAANAVVTKLESTYGTAAEGQQINLLQPFQGTSEEVREDPALLQLQAELILLLQRREEQSLGLTTEHPLIVDIDARIAKTRTLIAEQLQRTARTEMREYLGEALEAEAQAEALEGIAAALLGEVGRYPALEQEYIAVYRDFRVQSAILRRMLELQDMARSLIEKRERLLLELDGPYASAKPSRPNLPLLGTAIYGLGTLAALGWFALRDRIRG